MSSIRELIHFASDKSHLLIIFDISLPDTCSFEQAALAEPLSVLLHAFRRADLTPGSGRSVLIFGVGTIGLLACALAKAYGASRVCAIDINQARLDFALKQGFAQQVHCLPASERPKTTDEQVRRARENVSAALSVFNIPDGFDVIFECTGAEPCIQMSVFVSTMSASLSPSIDRSIILPLCRLR